MEVTKLRQSIHAMRTAPASAPDPALTKEKETAPLIRLANLSPMLHPRRTHLCIDQASSYKLVVIALMGPSSTTFATDLRGKSLRETHTPPRLPPTKVERAETVPSEPDCCVLSKEALEGAESPMIMCLHGWVQQCEVLMLVDSGSSHSFINSSLAHQLQGVQ
ncbi:uncharacterized protein LOC123407740 [Hordeum vulgare subsp. vulgare]|uniref:Predicted protein n=1 Tax=Hordeum vulgare subsp. vulgare TaxID=112509 RepID=F2EDC0_HORVV|nr:uncharacterized protein LOC123407740 [Hordeum vulgare subsp. vulgare]BAK05342.1 predicted protein [Hordeum vulgare subsp. vulgare]